MEEHLSLLEDFKSKLVHRIRDSRFLVRCRQGEVELNELKLFLVQQGIYSSYFTRYLCALMANLPSNTQVSRLAENLCEELGLTEDSATPHSVLYRNMLIHFELSQEGQRPLLGTRRLIDTMFDHCRDANVARGLGALCLGAEALVPSIYTDLLKGFKAAGVTDDAVEFFRIHVECDDGHADTMQNIMVELARTNPDQIARMLSAGNALVDARLDFFESIEAQCQTRTAPADRATAPTH
ncbi:iron-containing redox enzyme family protein [Variovorax sp. ZS18.2.2]|uniref:TenA family transcriptional regulator n=1 Tax=Variovorax sp. ZS18.2.2 TaxID=2971255 RepID=UPI00215108FB|nr:iron-containing redox enzyme family protein [Variovorax sp. ZS18.2.2]MCR6480865.1 iron-containing redox enzyme family protein [Variovorax sp. ZS18.2.2]